MPDQDSQLDSPISRRKAMKGLAALALVVIEVGCTSPNSSSTATSTPTATPLRPGSIIYTYKGHSDQVLTVAWSPDGRRIASQASLASDFSASSKNEDAPIAAYHLR